MRPSDRWAGHRKETEIHIPEWGGHTNGQIPASALSPVPATLAGSGYLRSDAARQYTALNDAFRTRFGTDLVITEGYRSLARQQYLYDGFMSGQPGFNLAAEPGTSNHGWATACDFGGDVASYDTQQKAWMDVNAPIFGWSPTGNGFSRREPWHFDYIRAYEPITTPPVKKEKDMFVLKTIGNLNEVPSGYTALVGIRTLRHLDADQVTLIRAAGVDYYERTPADFYKTISALSIPRAALVVNADYARAATD